MASVKFEINNNKTGKTTTVNCVLPDKFDDLTSSDLLLLCDGIEKNYTITDFKLLLIHRYAGLNNEDFALLKENTFALSELIASIDIDLYNIQSDVNILPEIIHDGKTYFGRHGDFGNLTFGQLAFAENTFNAFIDSKEIKYLKMLIEILYLPEKHATFNNKLVDKDDLLFDSMPFNLLNAAGIVYSANRKQFFSRFKHLFPKPSDEHAQLNQTFNDGQISFDYTLYERMLNDQAGGKFGNYLETFNSPADVVLTHLDNLVKNAA